jgi:sodium/bile acid cotransporter 7
LPVNPFKFLHRFGLDAFLLGLIGAVLLAVAWPQLGKTDGLLHIDLFTNYGVAVVFLLYGLTLAPDRLKAGLMNWRLHLLVQSATFLLFPALVWSLDHLAGDTISPDLKLGFFYLAASPSTISSSVAMTSIARGNVAGAIFNASLSSLIGVLATPLWVNWYLSMSGQSLALGHVILKIVLLVLAPILIGQVLRPWLFGWLSRHMGLVKFLDRATILAIVFNSFADSMADGVWSGRGIDVLGIIAVTSVGLFFTVFLLLDLTCRLLGFDRADTIAGVFCGTKKSLAAGVPMAKVMFGASPVLGLIIAPIMVYHFLQLVAASVIARRWGARPAAE